MTQSINATTLSETTTAEETAAAAKKAATKAKRAATKARKVATIAAIVAPFEEDACEASKEVASAEIVATVAEAEAAVLRKAAAKAKRAATKVRKETELAVLRAEIAAIDAIPQVRPVMTAESAALLKKAGQRISQIDDINDATEDCARALLEGSMPSDSAVYGAITDDTLFGIREIAYYMMDEDGELSEKTLLAYSRLIAALALSFPTYTTQHSTSHYYNMHGPEARTMVNNALSVEGYAKGMPKILEAYASKNAYDLDWMLLDDKMLYPYMTSKMILDAIFHLAGDTAVLDTKFADLIAEHRLSKV